MPSRDITIQGVVFSVEDKYAEGHTVTANEAGALNQVRAENLRNNFASTVKDLKLERVRAANDLADDAEVADDLLNGFTFSEEDVEELRGKFAAAATAYQFGARGGGTRVVDPVQREARRIATERVEAAIKAKYGKLDAVDSAKKKELIDQLSQREDVQTLAKSNIEQANAVAADLDL